MHLDAEKEMMSQCVALLGKFIAVREPNIRYLGLVSYHLWTSLNLVIYLCGVFSLIWCMICRKTWQGCYWSQMCKILLEGIKLRSSLPWKIQISGTVLNSYKVHLLNLYMEIAKFFIAYTDYQHIFVWLTHSPVVLLIHLLFCMLIINAITVLEGVLLIFYMECVMSLMQKILLRSCCR